MTSSCIPCLVQNVDRHRGAISNRTEESCHPMAIRGRGSNSDLPRTRFDGSLDTHSKQESATYDLCHNDVINWMHFPRYWPFVRGIHRWPVNSPHKCQWREVLMFSLICVWINDWVNNRKAGDLGRHHAHYEVIVMINNNWAALPMMNGLQSTECHCPALVMYYEHANWAVREWTYQYRYKWAVLAV